MMTGFLFSRKKSWLRWKEEVSSPFRLDRRFYDWEFLEIGFFADL